MALALDKAHRAGIVHRDLKPANVMFDRSGEPILMDFGLAWMAHETDARVTQSGAIIGTPAYMSPEQAEGDADKVGAASDIYSLGAVLYELLAGGPIHTGGVTRVLFKLMHNAPTRPSEVRGDVDPNLEAICWKAISKRPEDRFSSAAEFAEALARFIEGQPWESAVTRSVSEGERSTGPSIPSLVKRPPSLTLRVSESDRTDVLTPDTSAKSIAYQSSSSPGSRSKSHRKSRFVLASVLLIGVLGDAWAIVASRTKPHDDEDRVQKNDGGQVVQSRRTQPDNSPPRAIAPFDFQQAQAHQQAWAKHLGVPVEYTNSIGMRFVLIPPGEFKMGSTLTEIQDALSQVNDNHWKECIQSEAPQHTVILAQPIYLGVYEVTQAEYEKVMSVNPSEITLLGAKKEVVSGMDTTLHPVEKVSWNDAVEFCVKLSQHEQLKPFCLRAGETFT